MLKLRGERQSATPCSSSRAGARLARSGRLGLLGLLGLLTSTCSSASSTPVVNTEVKDWLASSAGPKYSVQLLTGALPPTSRPPAGTRSVVMTKKNGKKYRCHLPSMSNDTATAAATANKPVPPVAKYLLPLKGTCFYRLEGWWTYEFCYMKGIRQFHQEKVKGAANAKAGQEATQVTQDYTLGSWPADAAESAKPSALDAIEFQLLNIFELSRALSCLQCGLLAHSSS